MANFGAEAAVRPTGPISVQIVNNALSYSDEFDYFVGWCHVRPALSNL
jgi:hypothetical protein